MKKINSSCLFCFSNLFFVYLYFTLYKKLTQKLELMIDDIVFIYDGNLGRIKNLLNLYENLTGNQRGRRTTQSTDILRSAVVFLHATMEDFLRSLLKLRLPLEIEPKLKDIPLYGPTRDDKQAKFSLAYLSKFRGQTVDEVVEKSVHSYLDRQSFNNSSDISASLMRIGLYITPAMQSCYSVLDNMIKRRHLIVHQTDKEIRRGRGFHSTKSISTRDVKLWIKRVDTFVKEILNQL